jgi:DNA polymerase-4
VGGDVELRHGIVLAKNEIAKKYGIITGEAIWQAKSKCPDLVSVKPDYPKYLKFSRLAREIYNRYTNQVESYGIDECWLDVTGSAGLFGDGKMIADEIRATIRRELGITASCGVSYNKIFAKLGSDYKKPDATTVISHDNYKAVAWKLPAADLLYVGPATAKKLHRLGLYTIGQLANADLGLLNSQFGKWGIVLNRFANGEDNSAVAQTGEEAIIKSVGNSTTLPHDISTAAEVKKVIYMLSESVASRLRDHKLKATTVQIYVRDNELFACERQGGLRYPSCLTTEIADKAFEIYTKKYLYCRPIRSFGVRACKLEAGDKAVQIDLFADHEKRERLEKLEIAIDELRGRFGYRIIQRGIIYEDRKLTGINPKEQTIHPINFFDTPITADYQMKHS